MQDIDTIETSNTHWLLMCASVTYFAIFVLVWYDNASNIYRQVIRH